MDLEFIATCMEPQLVAPLLTKLGPILIQKGHYKKKNYSKHKREEPEEPESAACSICRSVFCITLSKEKCNLLHTLYSLLRHSEPWHWSPKGHLPFDRYDS